VAEPDDKTCGDDSDVAKSIAHNMKEYSAHVHGSVRMAVAIVTTVTVLVILTPIMRVVMAILAVDVPVCLALLSLIGVRGEMLMMGMVALRVIMSMIVAMVMVLCPVRNNCPTACTGFCVTLGATWSLEGRSCVTLPGLVDGNT